MVFVNGVKDIQDAAYNGARTVVCLFILSTVNVNTYQSLNDLKLRKILWKKIAPENTKKLHTKVPHNRPQTFFLVMACLPKRPQNKNPVPPKEAP